MTAFLISPATVHFFSGRSGINPKTLAGSDARAAETSKHHLGRPDLADPANELAAVAAGILTVRSRPGGAEQVDD